MPSAFAAGSCRQNSSSLVTTLLTLSYLIKFTPKELIVKRYGASSGSSYLNLARN
jgi:hypothetical protein